jgi:hypothetical protein
MKKVLENQLGKYGPQSVGFLSYASLIPGPWNLSSTEGAWEDLGLIFGLKIPIGKALSKVGPVSAEAVGLTGVAGLALTIGATGDNIYAYAAAAPTCGCGSK